MSDQVKAQFDQAAERYDEQRRGLIPCFDDFYGTAVDWTEVVSEEPRILDLGAGTGLLTAMMLDKFPHAEFTLIDFSDEMLAQAKTRFAGRNNLTYIAEDYSAYPFKDSYDAVVSSLSIHHLPHDQKRSLFRTVRGLLKPGGRFVNADQSAGGSLSFDQTYRQSWLRSVENSGIGGEAIRASVERRSHDINAGLPEQLQWLREAGFASADCVYKHHEFTVYVALA
ncbi:class I SAM-dependent methyltransferase [Paenibacillus soyae]|uniref:Class I SAM-dependent methyltransferase n=1 Tax=Paenibacillus soyae TaxID=2969249 RepID=A0A9X2SCQ9_9BACL|nr:class I SAM-dependent methyltransferase [Paenibacillus soyae]MCR2807023.1 class I SAM-dependent methyltransferase [Paenibacillus soyae]